MSVRILHGDCRDVLRTSCGEDIMMVRTIKGYMVPSLRHPLRDRGMDFYETPPIATQSLLRAEKLPHRIWEPACGRGAIVNELQAAGHDVIATDLVDYGQDYSRRDFLMEFESPAGTEAIVTNPPFKLATEFAEHAIELCSLVAMLLRLAFLESERRELLIGKLSRVHVFGRRLPMMHRDGWTGPKSTSATAFAWFIWDRSHSGATELHRI